MTTRLESSIEDALLFIQRREFRHKSLTGNQLVAATREYENIRQLMKLSERQKIGYIESILKCSECKKWSEAESMLDAAMSEFHRYFRPYIDDLKRQTSSRDHRGSWKAALSQRPKSDLPIRPMNQMNLNPTQPERPSSERRHALVSQNSSRSSQTGTPRNGRKGDTQADRLAVRFRNIYRYEWKDAYNELCPNGRQMSVTDYNKVIDFLYQIAQDSYHIHCKRLAEKQISALEDEIERVMAFGYHNDQKKFVPSDEDRDYLISYRKHNAAMSVKAVIDSFNKGQLKGIQQKLRMTGGRNVEKFAAACTETSWWMCVQDPPVVMDDPKEMKFDSELYEPYDKSGTAVEFYVWPALLQGDKLGPVLARGVAHCR